ncbi:hypothetical protein HYH02_008793 [Chlamydomonas schloesseri]|uniref:Uncharacterized protein n=1 Tax=Chlamydomonas schloesseri TaxID=2026947 RepID=A0A836B265_9CHLO|nr:hypothetical protein HYH02_008793 [Chlamydomonas schloesseri]|eukprot:KAG2445327.1 hypothetical protein HYH02_008793 [Chlamydomonas schloesseri]
MAAESSSQPLREDGGSEASTSGRRDARFHLTPMTAAGIGLLVVAVGAAFAARRGARKHRSSRGGSTPRIPLKELVRFREQQWFLEELENSRDGDPNAMLRLAKMYLYGQGCERSVNIAQEWLRRARAGGVYCTLDELLTAEDLDSIRRQHRADNAKRLEAARRGAASSSASPGVGGGTGSVTRRPLAEVAELEEVAAGGGAGKAGVVRPGVRGRTGRSEAAGRALGLRMADTVAGSAA